jgi:RNA-directed DNA polymerase
VRNRRLNGAWERFVTFDRLIRAFYRAASGKFNREAVLSFNTQLEKGIFKIRDDLLNDTYEWGPYRHFWVTDPKLRLIESASFRDRIVHQALVEVLEPWIDPAFFYHSYACRAGKGTHAAARQVQSWAARFPDQYYLQMDVSKFFPSIDRVVLYSLVENKISDEKMLKLIGSLIQSAPGTKGIPIGNLTSQLFANLFLDVLDQYIKRELRIPYYIRYMDDFVIIHPSRNFLTELRRKIEDFGHEKLKLNFHPSKVLINTVKEGIGFVGFRSLPNGLYLRGRSVRRFRKRLSEDLTLDRKVKRLLSYQGHAKHAKDSARLIDDFRKTAFSGRNLMEEL